MSEGPVFSSQPPAISHQPEQEPRSNKPDYSTVFVIACGFLAIALLCCAWYSSKLDSAHAKIRELQTANDDLDTQLKEQKRLNLTLTERLDESNQAMDDAGQIMGQAGQIIVSCMEALPPATRRRIQSQNRIIVRDQRRFADHIIGSPQ